MRFNSTESDAIDFSWEYGNLMPFCESDHQMMLVVYNPERQEFCKLENAALRGDKTVRLNFLKISKGTLYITTSVFILRARN
ncbi:hypothetical protein D3C78_1679410 [compost metagenome]